MTSTDDAVSVRPWTLRHGEKVLLSQPQIGNARSHLAYQIKLAYVPEPSTLLVLGLGMVFLRLRRR